MNLRMDVADLFYNSVLQNSTYESYLEVPSYPHTNESIWFLGRSYNLPEDQLKLEEDVKTRFWFTYRKNFIHIGSTTITSDQGWGCMLRCGQMMMAQSILCNHLGRDWRWKGETEVEVLQKFDKILRLFLDERDMCYSIHQIASMGVAEGKPIGNWFGPNTVAQCLKKLSQYDKWGDISVYICMDNVVILSEIASHCLKTREHEMARSHGIPSKNESSLPSSSSSSSSSCWKPILIVIPVMLGVGDINPIYCDQLKACFRLEQTVGMLGGKPSHAYWFVGYTENNFFYFDPHVTQSRVNRHDNTDTLQETFHVRRPNYVNIKHLDPSLAFGFFCKTEEDFTKLSRGLRDISKDSKNFMFEIFDTRPSHLTVYKSQRSKLVDEQENYEDFEIID